MSDEALYVASMADRGDDRAYCIELTHMPEGRQLKSLLREIYQVNGVRQKDDAPIAIQGRCLLVTIGHSDLQHRLYVVLKIIQRLREFNLHTGVLRGPLANDLQEPLDSGVAVRVLPHLWWVPPALRPRQREY